MAHGATGSGTTEAHLLSGANNFQQWALRTGTPQTLGGPEWVYLSADWDGDRRADLLAVARSGTSSGSTEVHVLSGGSNFSRWALHAATPLPQTGAPWDFAAGDWDGDGRADLFAVARAQTGTRSTEVQLLPGAGNLQQWLLRTGTPLHETPTGSSLTASLAASSQQPLLTASPRGTAGLGWLITR